MGAGILHRGHNLNREELLADLLHNYGDPPPGHDLHVDEWHLGYAPRVKWCGQYGWPCDHEGEWHGHWYAVKPGQDTAFSAVSWQRDYANV